MATYADASYFIALVDPQDQWHRRAVDLLAHAKKRAPVRIHALALGEVVAVLGSRRGGKAAFDVYWALRDTTELHLPTAEELDASMQLVLRYGGRLSLSDCLFLYLMNQDVNSEILSFDAGFDGKGVRRLAGRP